MGTQTKRKPQDTYRSLLTPAAKPELTLGSWRPKRGEEAAQRQRGANAFRNVPRTTLNWGKP